MKSDQGSSGLEAMQKAFTSMGGANGLDWGNYWRNQDKILKSMQELAGGWFERRHEATTAAIDAVRRCDETKSPADAVREYQIWLIGSMQRVVADCLACQKHLMAVAELSAPQSDGVEQAPEPPSKPGRVGKDEREAA